MFTSPHNFTRLSCVVKSCICRDFSRFRPLIQSNVDLNGLLSTRLTALTTSHSFYSESNKCKQKSWFLQRQQQGQQSESHFSQCMIPTRRFKTMSGVYIKNNTDDNERLNISIDILRDGNLKSFNLNRLKSESLESSLQRLQMNLVKKLIKKKKKVKKAAKLEVECSPNSASTSNLEPVDEIPVHIIHNGKAVDLSMTNEDAWIDGGILKVENEEIRMYYNNPSVKLNGLSSVVLEGFPIYPDAEFEFVDENICEFYWKTFDSKDLMKINQLISKKKLDLSEAVLGNCFIPSKEDIGKYLLLACLPKKGNRIGRLETVLSKSLITAGPGPCPFEKRHIFTQLNTEHGVFRMLTYNLLADMYSDTDAAKTELFAHCPPHALEMSYRKHLLMKEIIGYQADLMCMQEVDRSIFKHYLQPVLKLHGYTGVFRPKAGTQVGEGCATFLRDTKFEVVEQLDITLSEYLSSHQDVADIWSEVSKSETLKHRVEERSSILQVTVLKSVENPESYICLGNTHLYFHPTADNIRLIHGATALRYLQSVWKTYQQNGKKSALIFCGDFNSDPKVGVYQLYTTKHVPANSIDWDSAGPDQKISLSLQQPMAIESACGTPAYTNFTPLFQETLDYIFIESDKLAVESVVPLPDHEEVIANLGLPSIVFPSDHIALACDLKFKK